MITQVDVFRSGSLDESKSGDPLAYISPSRLKSFLTCRLKFYYEKVLGLRTPASPSLQIGKAVHAGLQHFHMARWRGGDTSPESVINAYNQSYIELEGEDHVEYGDKSRDDCIETGRRVLDAYLSSDVATDGRRILGVEVYLRREEDLPMPLVGVLDLVVEGNVPVDFKTVAATPSLDDEAWLNQLQLTAYHLLMEDAVEAEPGPGELVYLAKLKTPKVIKQVLPPVDQTAIDRFKALAETYVEGVAREDYYPSPGMHCRFCSFRNQCRAWTGKSVQAE